METIEFVLYPITFILEGLFYLLVRIFNSQVLIIIPVFAILVSIIIKPIQIRLKKIEVATSEKIKKIENEIEILSSNLDSERKFHIRDQLYKKYSYSPFESIKLTLSFISLIPILLSVIIIFDDSPLLLNGLFFGEPLSDPDQLFFGVNILPIIMFLLTIFDSFYRYPNDSNLRKRFLIVAIILLAIVYNLPSSLILFWISMNLVNLFFYFLNNNAEDKNT